ncbi:MAG: putative amidoligase domain-containing protein [Syntrophothermus sp.]
MVCEATAEIRPGYSESPLNLTSKVFQILEYGHDKAPDLEFFSGHFVENYAIGGHIHFSVEPTGRKEEEDVEEKEIGTPVYKALLGLILVRFPTLKLLNLYLNS